MRAAVVGVPWASPERADQYATLLDAVTNADPVERFLSPWIILEDGRILNPHQIADRRKLARGGSLQRRWICESRSPWLL